MSKYDKCHVLFHVPAKRIRRSKYRPDGSYTLPYDYYYCDAGRNAETYFGHRTYEHHGEVACWDCDAPLMREVVQTQLVSVNATDKDN